MTSIGENEITAAYRPSDRLPEALQSHDVEEADGAEPRFNAARRIAILVLGMHRSGTSAITRVLSLLGADLPSNLMPAAEGDNEAGFWESLGVYHLNDEILASVGSSWDDWRRFNPDWFRSAVRNPFKARGLEILEQDFPGSSLFVLKDPRFCRLLPFWLEVLHEFHVEPACVLPIRNPLDVAASLKKRNAFSPPKSHMLWLRHTLDAEYGSRGQRRAFISYDAMLDDWRGIVAELSQALEIAWPRRSATAEVEIDRFLEYRLRHFSPSDRGVFNDRGLGPWVKDAYSALHELLVDPESNRVQRRFDKLRAECDRASDALGVMLRLEEMEREELSAVTAARISELGKEALAYESRIAELEGVIEQQDIEHSNTPASLPVTEDFSPKEFSEQSEDCATAAVPQDARSKALLEYVATRHGDTAREWIRHHFALFGLPTSAEEAKLPEPTKADIDRWMAHLVNQSEIREDRLLIDSPDVSILLPVYNQIRYTLSCLVCLLAHRTRYSMEVIIGDDRSTDFTSILQECTIPGVRYIQHNENLGFLRNCNKIAGYARGRYLVLLNNDTVTLPGWLESLIETLESDPRVGLVGSKLVYPDGRLQEAGSIIWDDAGGWNWGNLKDPQDPEYNYLRDVDYCSGASIAMPAALWRELGGFDEERYQQAYYEDTDLAFRIREDKGLRVVYQPLSHLIHFEGVSSGRSLELGIKQFQQTNRPMFAERWKHVIYRYGNPLALPDNFLDRTPGKRLLLVDVVTPLPDQDSGSVDTFNYLKIFCQMGFKVTLLPENTSYNGHYVRDLQKLGVRVLHAPYVSGFEGALCKEAPRAGVIFIYRETAHRHMSLLRSVAPGIPVIFNTVDLHFLRKEREAELTGTQEARKEAAQTKIIEMAAIKQANATIVLSRHEENLLSRMAPDAKVARIPIVREIPGRSDVRYDDRRDLVFIGGFLHTPNVDAVRYFVQEVWPHVRQQDLGRPCKFIIAGSNIPTEVNQLAGADIAIRGHVPDLSDLYSTALLSVSPLRYGAGLKGKVVTSLSYGVPVVGTSISIEGSGLENEYHVLAADTPESMAAAISRLHKDAEIWKRLSDNGLAYCLEHFSLASVGQRLQALLSDLRII
jgi:GT2 family glycosyltransferase